MTERRCINEDCERAGQTVEIRTELDPFTGESFAVNDEQLYCPVAKGGCGEELSDD